MSDPTPYTPTDKEQEFLIEWGIAMGSTREEALAILAGDGGDDE